MLHNLSRSGTKIATVDVKAIFAPLHQNLRGFNICKYCPDFDKLCALENITLSLKVVAKTLTRMKQCEMFTLYYKICKILVFFIICKSYTYRLNSVTWKLRKYVTQKTKGHVIIENVI